MTIEVISMTLLTSNELMYLASIVAKDRKLREMLASSSVSQDSNAIELFTHVYGVKSILGNLHNDASFLATLLAKSYLLDRFGPLHFDAAGKAQGASGPDIQVTSANGIKIEAEIKTTVPYQPGFGAAQKREILKDLERLARSNADVKMLFITNDTSMKSLKARTFDAYRSEVEFINLCAEHS